MANFTTDMIRGELISLNFIPHRQELPELCNLQEREDVFHFIAMCPILKEFRCHFFGAQLLSLEEAINGDRGWDTIDALRHRKCIMEENFS